ncbi:MAG: ROK family protein [Oscillospiraceae bacterium]
MLHFGALEAGGTKMVCAVGNAQGQILERISLPTRDPENTMPEILAFFREKQVSAVGVGCFGPVDLDQTPQLMGTSPRRPSCNGEISPCCAASGRLWGWPWL